MTKEQFQPVPVTSPDMNPLRFGLRCLVDLQLKTIASFLKLEMRNLDTGQIIDIGAGESPWRSWLPDGCSYQGIDIQHASEFGMSSLVRDITLYDGGEMPFESNSFDGAFCIEVLEHTPSPELLLTEINRIIKPGSQLILTVPWSARRHHIPHDYHRFTRERLEILLENSGFKSIQIRERGDDYSVIANKLIIILIRNFKSLSLRSFLFRVPLLLMAFPFALLMLCVAHLSLFFGDNHSEDPLGYAATAVKRGS